MDSKFRTSSPMPERKNNNKWSDMKKEEKEQFLKERAIFLSRSLLEEHDTFTSTKIETSISESWFGQSFYVYITFEDHDEFTPIYFNYKITVEFDKNTGKEINHPTIASKVGIFPIPIMIPFPVLKSKL